MSEKETGYHVSARVQPLASFAPGQGAIIMALTGGRKLQERLAALGLFPGQRLTVCQNHGSSLVIRFNDNSLALGRGVSQKILALPTATTCLQPENCQCPIKDAQRPT
jgi:Fe2+ transport system protein FeoA